MFASLLDNLSTIVDSDAMRREVVERKIDSVEAMSQAVLSSEKVPNLPKRSLFRQNELRQQHEAWERSKQGLIDSDNLPDTETIVKDYLNGAVSHYQRTLYGYRELVLNRGFASDSTEQIDSYQRRYREFQNEKYYIAITPREWIDQKVEPYITNILYGEESEVAKLLGQQPVWSYRRFNEKHSGGFSTAGYDEPNTHNRRDRQDPPASKEGSSTNEKFDKKEAYTIFDTQVHAILDDIKEMVTKSSFKPKKETLRDLFALYEEIIVELGPRKIIEQSPPPMRSILRRATIRLHPDTIGQDSTAGEIDEDMGRLANQILSEFGRREQEDRNARS